MTCIITIFNKVAAAELPLRSFGNDRHHGTHGAGVGEPVSRGLWDFLKTWDDIIVIDIIYIDVYIYIYSNIYIYISADIHSLTVSYW